MQLVCSRSKLLYQVQVYPALKVAVTVLGFHDTTLTNTAI